MKSFRNDFDNFCENVPTEFGLQVSRQAEFSFHKHLIITHEISHHFCVDSRWNRQNRPILTLLKLRLTCLRFYDAPINMLCNLYSFSLSALAIIFFILQPGNVFPTHFMFIVLFVQDNLELMNFVLPLPFWPYPNKLSSFKN